MFDSTISDAENKFISYLPKTNSYYSNKRNYSFDPKTNENTTSTEGQIPLQMIK